MNEINDSYWKVYTRATATSLLRNGLMLEYTYVDPMRISVMQSTDRFQIQSWDTDGRFNIQPWTFGTYLRSVLMLHDVLRMPASAAKDRMDRRYLASGNLGQLLMLEPHYFKGWIDFIAMGMVGIGR